MIKEVNDIVRNNTLSPARVANALDGDKAYLATGTDTYAVSIGSTITTLNTRDLLYVVIPNANTGTGPTLAVTGSSLIGTYNIKDNAGNNLAAGDLKANGLYVFMYDGTNLRVTNLGGGGGLVSVDWGDIGGTLSDQTDLQTALDAKQATLVSATNIKTINSNSLLGSGNLVIDASMWYNVRNYGAVGDGTTNDKAAFEAAIAACPAGGTVYVPGTTSSTVGYKITGTITISKRINLIGDGRNSRIETAQTTGDLFVFDGTNFAGQLAGVQVRNLRIVNTNTAASNPTAGRGIYVQWYSLMILDNVAIEGFYTCMNATNGYQLMIDHCTFINYVSAGLAVQNTDGTVPMGDWGDSSISNSYFVAGVRDATYGIYQENSGGMKITNCKFNGDASGGFLNTYSYYYAGSQETSDLQFTNNSFENFSTTGIYITKGSSNFSNVVIAGNQFAVGATGANPYVYINGVTGISVSGNSFTASPTITNFIVLNDCASVYCENSYVGNTSFAVSATGTTPDIWNPTITAGGTTGAQTINKAIGSVNFAAGATSLVVTNSQVSTSSLIIVTVQTNDTTAKSAAVVPGSGSFTIYLNAAATGETKVAFWVFNNRNRG